jgi:pimeloyl-ACP methyl ester carboxylesterase
MNRRSLFQLTTILLAALTLATAQAEETKSSWQGYDRYDFTVDGRPCLLVAPKTPAEGNPWIWRTEFFDAYPQADLALLEKGYHVAYMDMQNMYGAPVALDHMDKYYEYLTGTRGLSPKCVLEGFSRGGLFAFNWAARHPDRVASIYVDAPVCDIKSWPGGKGKGPGSKGDWDLCKQVYDFSSEGRAMAYRRNPIDNLKPLAEHKVPIIAVCGDADEVVPMDENILIVEQRYKKLGGEIKIIAKPGVGHHPHSLEDPKEIVDFILAHP